MLTFINKNQIARKLVRLSSKRTVFVMVNKINCVYSILGTVRPATHLQKAKRNTYEIRTRFA